MAIVQMQRINICALKKNRKAILERLQELGAMEVDIRLEDEELCEKQDVSSSRSTFERRSQTADQALHILDEYAPEKKGMLDSLAGKPLIDKESLAKAAAQQDNFMQTATKIIMLDKQVAESQAAAQKLENQAETLTPWLGLTVPVNFSGTRSTAFLIGTLPGQQDQQSVLKILADAAPEIEAVNVELISKDKDFTYLAVVCLRQDASKVEEALRTAGFAKPSSAVSKIPAQYKEELLTEMKEAQSKAEELGREIASYAASRQDLELISDYYQTRAEKYRILGELPQTKSTFAVSGYVPAQKAEAIVKELTDRYGAAAEAEEIAEDEEAPVLLHNNRFFRVCGGCACILRSSCKRRNRPHVLYIDFLCIFIRTDVVRCSLWIDRFAGMRNRSSEIPADRGEFKKIHSVILLVWYFHIGMGHTVRRLFWRRAGCHIGDLLWSQDIDPGIVVRTVE